MNQLEQDFLALKEKNDKLTKQLEEKGRLLREGLFHIIGDFLPNKDLAFLSKEECDKITKISKAKFISKYSDIKMEDSERFSEFCMKFRLDYMKDRIKEETGIDLGELDGK